MKKVKTYFRTFINSLIPYPPYYSKIPRKNFFYSMSYFLILLFTLNLIFITSIYSKLNYNNARTVFSSIISSLKQIPNDFYLQIDNGSLIKSYNRPFFFWINNPYKKLIIVVDENAQPEKIRSYNSLFLLTANDLVTFSNNSVQSTPLSSFGKITINKTVLQSSSDKLQTIVKFLPLIYICIIIILVLVVNIASLLTTLFYLFIASLIGYFTYRLVTKKFVSFKKSLQIAFHAATLPILVDYFIIMKPSLPFKFSFSIPQHLFPVVFIFLLSLFVFTGIYEAHVKHKQS